MELNTLEKFQLFYAILVAKFMSLKSADVAELPVTNRMLRYLVEECLADEKTSLAIAPYLARRVELNAFPHLTPALEMLVQRVDEGSWTEDQARKFITELFFPYPADDVTIERVRGTLRRQ